MSYLREKAGHPFKVDNLASDVRALWDSGFFDDIEVDMTRGDRGVILRFLVRERPNIKIDRVRRQRARSRTTSSTRRSRSSRTRS